MIKSLAGGKNGRKSLKFWVPKEERGGDFKSDEDMRQVFYGR